MSQIKIAALEIGTEELIRRLDRIAAIIEQVDIRCMACDGPVTPTLEEITEAEMIEIYQLAKLERSGPNSPGD